MTAPAGEAAAQDAHYWTNQHGDRATLLGGAVVGSAVDLSAVYYNPGALSLIEDPDLFAATKVFEWARVTAEGAGEPRIKIGDNRLGLAPGFFAGLLPFRFLGSDKLSYSMFTRYSFDATLRTVGTGSEDVLPPPSGLEDFYASLEFEGRLSETWVGTTWSRPFRRIGFGVSQFLAVRTQSSGSETLLEAYAPAGTAAIGLNRFRYRYFNYRLLWKIGIAGEWQGWSIGLTLTTPSVSLFGSGEVEVNQTVFGQDLDGDDVPDPLFAADFQDGVSARYRSPFSAALGASKRFGATRVHLTGEWFAKVGASTVLDPEPFEGQSTGDTLTLTVTQALDQILNVALGVEHRFTPTTAVYGSMRTDRSGRSPSQGVNTGITSWDIYFLTAGARFRAAGADFTFGLGYGFGSEDVPVQDRPGDLGETLPEQIRVRYRNYRLIFAFAF
jgi:hypothetical protein